MNEFERGFLRYLKFKEIQEDRQIIQSGGVLETVKIGKHKLEYDITSYGNDTIDLLAIAKKKANDKQPCFMMTITPGGASELQSISRGITCFEDDHDNSADIVLAAIEIAKLKGAKTFEFTDNSTKKVNGKKLPLADLIFLTTGKTWYERILQIRALDKAEAIENRRSVVKKSNWDEVHQNLIKKGVNINMDTSDINITSQGSLMKVLLRAKISKKYANFFDEHMENLLNSVGIQSMQGVHWIMDIK